MWPLEVVGLILVSVVVRSSGTVVHEVPLGSVAILPCPSNEDALHRFQYWQVGEDHVIGPGNPFNERKYHYEVWSGRLFIKSVSTQEAGLYKCISKHVANAGLNIQAVELVVKRDWEETFEEDPQANAYRAVISILVLLILSLMGAFAYFVKTRRTRNFTDMAREESPDEGPSPRGPQRAYNPTTTEKPSNSRSSRALDNAIVETDIKTSFSLAEYP